VALSLHNSSKSGLQLCANVYCVWLGGGRSNGLFFYPKRHMDVNGSDRWGYKLFNKGHICIWHKLGLDYYWSLPSTLTIEMSSYGLFIDWRYSDCNFILYFKDFFTKTMFHIQHNIKQYHSFNLNWVTRLM
jgi:hypothetical protein